MSTDVLVQGNFGQSEIDGAENSSNDYFGVKGMSSETISTLQKSDKHCHDANQHSRKIIPFEIERSSQNRNDANKIDIGKSDKHQCSYCPYGTSKPSKLNRHIRAIHEDGEVEKQYSCEMCDYSTDEK